jgi:hypothetical protein
MASRMESSGVAGMIQLSQAAFDLLNQHYPHFVCSERGAIEIKVFKQSSL